MCVCVCDSVLLQWTVVLWSRINDTCRLSDVRFWRRYLSWPGMHVQTKVDWYAEQYVADVCIYRGFIVYSFMCVLSVYLFGHPCGVSNKLWGRWWWYEHLTYSYEIPNFRKVSRKIVEETYAKLTNFPQSFPKISARALPWRPRLELCMSRPQVPRLRPSSIHTARGQNVRCAER